MDRSGDMADKIGTGELDEISTCRNFRQVRKDKVSDSDPASFLGRHHIYF